MIDPTNPNPAFYSESNQNSPFRFIRISNSKYDWTKTLENKCCICDTVEIDDGHAVTFTHPSGIPSIYCGDCYEDDEAIVHCDGCKDEINGDEIFDIYEVPDDFNLPLSMDHYSAICTDCMEDSDNDMINTEDKDTTMNNNDDNVREMVTDIKDSFRRQLSSNPTLEALERIETKVDKLNEYLEARRAVTNDYLQGDITFEEADEILERINQRLNRD